uniref:ABI family member 3 binding protein n=1 Tax=Salarias fasciatus TaxID=181472 RepID=A0A672HGE0_SALFA
RSIFQLLICFYLRSGLLVLSCRSFRDFRFAPASPVRRQNMKVRISATADTIVMKFLRPNADTKLEGYILGYGSSMFSKQFIPLPEDGRPYVSEMDAEPKYLIAVQPIPTNEVKKHCTGKVQLERPLHLVIGSVTPTSVLLSWGTLLKTPYEGNIMDECLEDGHYTVRYRERSRKWNYQTCPTSDTVIDNLKPNTVYEFGVQPSSKDGAGAWSRPVFHNIKGKPLPRPALATEKAGSSNDGKRHDELVPLPSLLLSSRHVEHGRVSTGSKRWMISPLPHLRLHPATPHAPTLSLSLSPYVPPLSAQHTPVTPAHSQPEQFSLSFGSRLCLFLCHSIHRPLFHVLFNCCICSIVSFSATRFDIYENSSIFRPLPASDVDFMGKKRFVAPHVIYKTDKKPEEPCSITSSLTYFPDEEGSDQNVTGPPRVPPSNLTVVTVEGCPSFVILDWEKSDNETREYEVVSTAKGPNGQQVSILTTNQTHTAVENLKPESSYEFKVTPKNELGSGPSTEPVSFSTESGDGALKLSFLVSGKDAIWTQFPFKADAYSECNGKQYVKRTWYRKFVGIQLCNSLRYKIYLSDSLNGKFYNIGDQTGHGEDHCQFVDSFLDGRTGSQMFADQLPSRPGYFRAMRQEPVNFGEIGGKSHVTYVGWYECGTPIPGKW